MGCFWSRCAHNTPKLKRSSPVASIAGPENKGEEFTEYQHRRAKMIAYRGQSLGTQITENSFEGQAINLETVGDENSDERSLSSDDGSFSKPAADSAARNGLRQLDRRPADLGDTSSVNVLPIRDHKMLWEILSARPGWEREVHEGTRDITKGSVQYQMRTLKTDLEPLQFPSACPLACRLPWPELYDASTYMLSSFVEMVNVCTGSNIFELRIANDFKTNNVDYVNPRINTMPSPPPKNGTNGCGSQADCLSRATMEGDRGTTISTSMFSNSSQAVQDVDLDSVERTPASIHNIRMGAEIQPPLRPAQGRIRKRGPIETATEEQAAVRNSEDPGSSKAYRQTFPVRPDLFANIPKPDGQPPPVFFKGKPAILQSSSAEAAPASEVPPSGLFANVPKPDGRPPPVCGKQSIFQPSLAKRIWTGPSPETKLLTSDALQKISNDFDSSSARPPPRQELVTFADPYQTPNRGTTSAYARNEYPNLRKHLLLKYFHAPVMGSGCRLTL